MNPDLKKFRSFALTAALLALTALQPSKAAAQISHPGFGKDERAPTGTPFVLPPGLEIAGPIVGADDDGNCPKPRTDTVGTGLWVRVCVPVKNRTGGPVTVIFPPGLVIVSASEGFQHGLLVERQVLTVPPIMPGPGRLKDKDEDVIYIPIHTYCLNDGKEGSTPGKPYKLGPVSQHPAMAEFYRIMEGKDARDHGERVEVVQQALWDLIAAGGMNDQIREDLASIDRIAPLK